MRPEIKIPFKTLLLLMSLTFTSIGCSSSSSEPKTTTINSSNTSTQTITGNLDTAGDANPNRRGSLVSATFLSTTPATTLSLVFQFLTNNGIFDASLQNVSSNYGVNSYKISYKTPDPAGNLISASGLLTLPIKESGLSSPLLSYQHGSLFQHTGAPSLNHDHTSASVLTASLGYLVSTPDYIGYGDSAHLPHPYSHSQTLASSGIDMLRAVKTFLANNTIQSNGQLFLTGYSEGGKATLAMHREIETQFSNEFQVTATTVGAGNYDMSATTSALLNSATVDPNIPAYLGWVLKSYEDIYQLNRLSSIVMPNYLSVIESSYDGLNSGQQINDLLTPTLTALIQPQFLVDYLGAGELDVKAALSDNDDYDWAPIAPIHFFHGREDKIVPYFNTENAYNKMIQNGSTSIQVTDCNAGLLPANHENCTTPYINFSYGLLATYANDL